MKTPTTTLTLPLFMQHAAGLALAAILTLGCSDHVGQSGGSGEGNGADTDPDSHAEHDHLAHGSHGPHGGDLVELGGDAYHAEVTHDEKTRTVTVYILDAAAKQSVAIDAKELVVNLMHDGTPEQFKLPASPTDADAEGKSSRFVSADAELAGELDHHQATIVVSIEGKQLRGKFVDEHDDHEGHDHQGHDDHDHDHDNHDHDEHDHDEHDH